MSSEKLNKLVEKVQAAVALVFGSEEPEVAASGKSAYWSFQTAGGNSFKIRVSDHAQVAGGGYRHDPLLGGERMGDASIQFVVGDGSLRLSAEKIAEKIKAAYEARDAQAEEEFRAWDRAREEDARNRKIALVMNCDKFGGVEGKIKFLNKKIDDLSYQMKNGMFIGPKRNLLNKIESMKAEIEDLKSIIN